jgi:hypothetical protein
MTEPATLPIEQRTRVGLLFYVALNIISPKNEMTDKLKPLLTAFPEIDTAAMGFPQGWIMKRYGLNKRLIIRTV